MILKFSKIFEEKSEKFKIGIDLHGVIDTMPEFFSFLSLSIIDSGGEIHIITGSSWNTEAERSIHKYGIKYTHRFSVYDYLISKEIPAEGYHHFKDGTKQVKFPNNIWDRQKGEYCQRNNIDLHIDDTIIYGDYFTTPFCHFSSNK